MTREEQIIEAGAYHSCGRRPPKTCGHNMHGLSYINRNLAFEAGAKWADEHPNPDTVKRIFEFALNNTNFLVVDSLQGIDFEVLVVQAMKE